MEAYGATQKEINREINKLQSIDVPKESKSFIIYHDNWDAWEVFRRVISQFRRGEMSGKPIALDYSSVTSIIGLFNCTDSLQIFDQVRLIEHGYLSALD